MSLFDLKAYIMKKLALAIFALLLLCALACDHTSKPHSENAKAQILRSQIHRDPSSLDPRKGGDMISALFHFMMFEGLVKLNPDGTVSPSGASNIDISQDRKHYTFYLKDLYWSNGDPITAQDYELTWKQVLSPTYPSLNAHLFFPIKNARAAKEGSATIDSIGVRAINDKTLLVTLEKPTPHFLEILSFCSFFPINQKIDGSQPLWAISEPEALVCNGPFILDQWKHSDYIILKRNPQYWAKERIALDEIRFYIISHPSTALSMFEHGDLDIIGVPIGTLPVETLTQMREMGELYIAPASGSTFCAFNTKRKPFTNRNIRRAFSISINRNEIVKNITQLGETPATGPIPPQLRREGVKTFFKDGDYKEARRLFDLGLQELGMTRDNLPPLTYLYFNSGNAHKIAQYMKEQWEKTFDISIQLENTEYKLLLDRLVKGKYDMGGGFWVAQYNDRMNILERFMHSDNAKNYPAWEDPYFQELINASFKVNDRETREDLLGEAEEYFIDEMPLAPIYHLVFPYLIHQYVDNVTFNPMGGIYFDHLSINHERVNCDERWTPSLAENAE